MTLESVYDDLIRLVCLDHDVAFSKEVIRSANMFTKDIDTYLLDWMVPLLILITYTRY
jgi:hypothetical protein